MHSDLSPHLHTPECNKIIDEFKNCENTNRFARFVGVCTKFEQQVFDCLKKERAQNQANNRRKALERQQKVREQMKSME